MAVTLNKANLVLKDANGNIGKIEQLSNRDLAKIKTAVSDVALVVNQSNHKPIVATTTNVGVVKPDNNTITIDSNGVLTATKATQDSAGQQINTTYVKGVTASNATITVTKGNGTTSTATINNVAHATKADSATKAIQDKNGAQIDTTYLPLSGGKMSGNITRNVDNAVLAICGGMNTDKSATLHLNGKDRADYSGEFHLVTSNGTNQYRLIGKPNGTLTWDEKNIVRSVNGVNADASGNIAIAIGTVKTINGVNADVNGNITLPLNYLPLSGGKMSGNIYRNADNSTLAVCGGTIPGKGASLHLSGKDRADYSGEFHLVTSNGTKEYRIIGKPNGTLTWDGKNIVRSVNGVNADASGNVSITSVNHATNADSATKAIQDKNGAQIDTTYVKGVTASNATITVTKGNGTTSTATINNVAHATKADSATNATNATKADSATNATNATNANHAKTADSATNATNLGGYPATKYIRSVNSITPDASGNVQLGNIGAITGEIKWFAFNTVPTGYLVCNGASVSRTTYANLFAVIGTTFGKGNGSTTFTLPNLIDKFIQGSTTVGTVKSAGLPNITGGFWDLTSTVETSTMGNADGVFFTNYTPEGNRVYSIYNTDIAQSPYGYKDGIGFNASRSNSIYGKSSTVQPPALTLLPCIKY